MTDEDILFPDVNYGENNKEKYQDLVTKEWSPFYKGQYWEIFIFCMAYAYAKKLTPTDPTGHGTLNAKVFRESTRHMMRALTISHEKNVSVIKDSNKVVRICEKYANAGIHDIHDRFINKPKDKLVEKIFLDMQREIMESQT